MAKRKTELRNQAGQVIGPHDEVPGPSPKLERIAAIKAAVDSGTLTMPKLTLGVELQPNPSASKDWSDDEETTGIGPVDDLQPIGRVTPVPAGPFDGLDMTAFIDPSLPPGTVSVDGQVIRLATEADEEPTLLGPNPTITEDDGEIDLAGLPRVTEWQVGIDWGASEPPRALAPEAEWKAFHESVELARKRVEFLDATAIALYGRGFPVQNCYTKAKLLWEQRCKEGIR